MCFILLVFTIALFCHCKAYCHCCFTWFVQHNNSSHIENPWYGSSPSQHEPLYAAWALSSQLCCACCDTTTAHVLQIWRCILLPTPHAIADTVSPNCTKSTHMILWKHMDTHEHAFARVLGTPNSQLKAGKAMHDGMHNSVQHAFAPIPFTSLCVLTTQNSVHIEIVHGLSRLNINDLLLQGWIHWCCGM